MKAPNRLGLVLLGCLASGSALAASGDDGATQGSALQKPGTKLSKLVADTEARPGFFLIKSITYADGTYAFVYDMADGAEVRLTYDAQTGKVQPPKSGGLFGN